jgi:purine-binding chemotaxis protein CheW
MHNESPVDRLIVFQVSKNLFALPIEDVLKVVNYPATDSSGLREMGLIQLGRYTIRVIDLQQQFNSKGISQSFNHSPFLMIMRSPWGELCGILVDEPPNLVELPREMLRSVPQSEYQSGVLKLVSHTAVVPQKNGTTTIFLLDIKRVLNPTVHESSQLALKSS